MDRAILGKFIRERRKSQKMTQADLANGLTQAGFPYNFTSISKWETGENAPPIEDRAFVEAISSLLKVSMQKFYEVADIHLYVLTQREEMIRRLERATPEQLDVFEKFMRAVMKEQSGEE